MFAILGVLCLLQTLTLAPAQLLTLRDGNVGVNFAGFHAGAGLGGLLTGNSAHGGLSASAGTPWGSNAAAGLAGDLNGRAAGVGYATAQANPSVGAGAVLGGVAGEHGFAASESYSPGKADISIDTIHKPRPVTSAPLPTVASHVQKVKPPKKYSLINQDVLSKSKVVNTQSYRKTAQRPQTLNQHVIAPQGNPVNLALDIPIGILRSLQQSLGALGGANAPAQGVPPNSG